VYYFHRASQTAVWARPTAESSHRLIVTAARAAAAEAESSKEEDLHDKDGKKRHEDEDDDNDGSDDDDNDSADDEDRDSQVEDGSVTSAEEEPTCPLPLPIATGFDFKGRPLPVCQWCSDPCRVQCARCLDAFYCGVEHQQYDWSDSHAEQCDSFVEAIALQLDFSVHTMHTKLHPRRGSNVDPYTAWTFNVFARFYCSRCEGPHTGRKKGSGKRSQLQWASARAALDLSLNDLHIVHVYKQQCKRCGTDALPVVARQELIDKVASLLRWLRDLTPDGHRDQLDVDQKQTPPHLAQFCEKCGYGASPHTH
jgi:hypothetical protein